MITTRKERIKVALWVSFWVTLFVCVLASVRLASVADYDQQIRDDKRHTAECLELNGTVKLGADGTYTGCTYTAP